MTTNTKRIKAPAILNRAAFELTVDTIARATTELRYLEAERDKLIQDAQAKYADWIATKEAEIALAVSMAEKYADEHRAELIPGKAKSNETPLARYGFRTSTPALKTLSGWTWEKVTAELQKYSFRKWLRVKTEPAKDLMLAAHQRRPERIAAVLKNVGVRVVQAETFFIEPKVDGADQVKAGGAS